MNEEKRKERMRVGEISLAPVDQGRLQGGMNVFWGVTCQDANSSSDKHGPSWAEDKNLSGMEMCLRGKKNI